MKEVFFAQKHDRGQLSLADLTHCQELKITIAGEVFPHLTNHLVLSYAN